MNVHYSGLVILSKIKNFIIELNELKSAAAYTMVN